MRICFRVLTWSLVAGWVSAQMLSPAADAGKRKEKKPATITRPTFDPDAAVVDLFDGLKQGSLESWLIPNDEHGGFVFVENKTDEPLTVKLPASVVAVHNLKQLNNQIGIGQGQFGQGQFGLGQFGQGQFGQGQFGRGQQNLGGGFGQMGQMGNMGFQNNGFNGIGMGNGIGTGMGNAMGNGIGIGMFSIPPQRRVRLPFYSVCLNHGLESPNQMMRYHLVETDRYTKDDTLKELLALVGTGRIRSEVSQAAAWHLTDGMSFEQLAAKQRFMLGVPSPYFQGNDVVRSAALVQFARQRACQRCRPTYAGVKPVRSYGNAVQEK